MDNTVNYADILTQVITELPPYIYTIIAQNPYPSMDVPP
jgi:hypothetical protein